MIFLINSYFILSAGVNICFMVLGSVAFQLSECFSIRLVGWFLLFSIQCFDPCRVIMLIFFTIYLSTYFQCLKIREPSLICCCCCFSHQFYLAVSNWWPNDSKSPQLSRTFLNIILTLLRSRWSYFFFWYPIPQFLC